MVITSFRTDALDKLCSENQMELLDSIDSLRLQGIDNYISLPQIIVCGDQSSGKSSVLEAISGVSFPVKSNLCTRFPIELVLRRTPQTTATVSIVPHSSRSESEQTTLSAFRAKLDGFEGLSSLVEDAQAAMGISMQGKAFSKDLLRVEITGPDRPHLTIVDLPGLIHSETKQQMASDVELIQDVVQDYMKEPRSIILAVVSAKNDIANQVVLKLARSADVTGNRTLGVITKPDTLIANSGSETSYMSLAKNQEVELSLGWHVLKNMDSEKGVFTLAQRDAKEAEFFLKRVWNELPKSSLGIDELRSRLSDVLLRQITSELPSLIAEIEAKFISCLDRLKKLGEPRASLHEQRLHLVQISQSFQLLVNASVAGTYNHPFFDDAKSERGYQQRLRAVVQNLNQDFATKLVKYGHHREIIDSKNPARVSKRVLPITRDSFIAEIQSLMQRTRGRELPGTFNPMIVQDLFLEQSKPWEAIALRHVKKIWDAAKAFLNLVVGYVADPMTSKLLIQEVFGPALNDLLKVLNAKAVELLGPHQNSHPITYNRYFTETLQQVRNERRNEDFTIIVKEFFNVTSVTSSTLVNKTVDLRGLVAALADRNEPDMDLFAASEALDCMNAYYKVALKRFIDDVAVELIEAKLVSVLGDILSPVAVYNMSSEQVALIAGESKESRDQRQQLEKQLDILRKGSDTCKRFVGPEIGEAAYGSINPEVNADCEERHCSDSDESSISDESKSQISDDGHPTPPADEMASIKEPLEELTEKPTEQPTAYDYVEDDDSWGRPTNANIKKGKKKQSFF